MKKFKHIGFQSKHHMVKYLDSHQWLFLFNVIPADRNRVISVMLGMFLMLCRPENVKGSV